MYYKRITPQPDLMNTPTGGMRTAQRISTKLPILLL